MGISMNFKQSLLFTNTTEFNLLWASDNRRDAEPIPVPRPMVAPPPLGTKHLSQEQILALENYRKWRTYRKSKEYNPNLYLYKN